MKKIVRVIVEITDIESEREAVRAVRFFFEDVARKEHWHVKGFEAVMARERKKGKRERRRFEAGR